MIVSDIDSLISKLHRTPDWDDFSHQCVRLRSSAAASAHAKLPALDEETQSKLARSAFQFATASKLTDKMKVEQDREPHIGRLKGTLSDQRELYSVALAQLKQHAAGLGNGS